jgi:mannose-6-phosphate isomerase-like protein (cupin superfamily)
MSHAKRAYALSSSGGQAVWFFGSLVTMKAVSSDTHNAFALQEQICPPGLQAPLHIHHHQDEAFYILEGRGHRHLWRAGLEGHRWQLCLPPKKGRPHLQS